MIAMLAYVFVHQPARGVGLQQYVSRLAGFHRALAVAPPAGFVKSWVWHLGTGPLGEAFEDWYLIEDWASLGALNHAAITGQPKAPHDQVAPLAASGAGAIYQLVYGAPTMAAKYRIRVAKPIGVRYETFQPRLEQAAGADGALWKRQMVLGPDLEFLIDSPKPPQEPMLGSLAEVAVLHQIHPALAPISSSGG
jgi:hypothetical protein